MDLHISAENYGNTLQVMVEQDGQRRGWSIDFSERRWRWALMDLLASIGLGEHESAIAMKYAEQLWHKTF